MKQSYLIAIVAIVISGCSSQSVKDQVITSQVANDIKADYVLPKSDSVLSSDLVLSRIDNMSERPSWLKESEIFKSENNNVYFLGKQTIPAEGNVEQAFRAAELNAKSGIAKAIEQKFTTVFQNAEEGYSVDATQARFMGIEASKEIKMGNIKVSKRYWEKYRTTTDSGQTVTKIDAFSLVEMPEANFKAAILDASRARQGKGGLSADFAKKVDQQWEEFTKPVEVERKSAGE